MSDAGARDRVVTIEYRSTTDAADADSGEPTETWATLIAGMPAAKIPVAGWERFRMDQTASRYDERWEINYRLDMDPELVDVPKTRRLVVGSRTLEIVAAEEVGRREGIALLTLASTKL